MPARLTALAAILAAACAATAAAPDGPVLIEGARWRLYGCDRLPGAAGFVDGAGPGSASAGPFTRLRPDGTLSFDSGEPANKAAWVFSPAAAPAPARAFTFVARLKADGADRAFDLDFRLGDPKAGAPGPRVKLVVRSDEVQIEKPDGQTSSTRRYRLDASQYHVYQLDVARTPRGAAAAVFVDGDAAPALTADIAQSARENHFAFGDMGASACQGTIDWMAWTDAAAVTPAALKGWLPASLGDLGWY